MQYRRSSGGARPLLFQRQRLTVLLRLGNPGKGDIRLVLPGRLLDLIHPLLWFQPPRHADLEYIFASSRNNRNIDNILKFASCNFRISGI